MKALEFEGEGLRARIRVRIERRGPRRYPCGGCGRRCSRVRDAKDRTWNDLPWAERPVRLVYSLRRVRCRFCGIRAEQVLFADPLARVTRRLRQQIGLDCQSMPTSHAAVRWRVSWGKAHRAEKAFLGEWEASRPRRRPHHLGADEIQRGKGQKYWTVLSDLVHGEVIGLAQDRTGDALKSLFLGRLDARQRAAVEAVCTDMHRGSGSTSDVWTARTGSNRCASRMRWASETRRKRAPSPSKLHGRPCSTMERPGSSCR